MAFLHNNLTKNGFIENGFDLGFEIQKNKAPWIVKSRARSSKNGP